MSDFALKVTNLDCQYNDRIILKNVNFIVQSGTTLGLKGHNGCGKSTLMATIAGVIPYYKGSITIENDEQSKFIHRNQEIAWIGTQSSFYPQISIYKNLNLWANLNNCDAHLIDTSLDYYALKSLSQNKVSELSRGQLQRLSLCRLLLTSAKIWLLDEPLTGLDQHGIALFKDSVQQFQQKGGIIILAPKYNDLQNCKLNIESFSLQ